MRLIGSRNSRPSCQTRPSRRPRGEQTLAASSETVKNLSNQPAGVLTALAEIRAGDTTTAEVIDAWLAPVPNLCESVLAWLDGSAEAAGGSLDSGPGSCLRESGGAARAGVSTRCDELRGSPEGGHNPKERAARRNRTRRAQARHFAGGQQAQGARTDRGREKGNRHRADHQKVLGLDRTYVTRLVRDQFAQESGESPPAEDYLDDKGGVKGQLRHRPSLLGAVSQVPVTKVLSEGNRAHSAWRALYGGHV